jgi:hypothetical protein
MKRLEVWFLVLAAVAGFALAGRLHPDLLAQREKYGLNQGKPLENATPLVAFTTVAMGGFRGIIADVLWLRASHLQEEGRFFELVQLSDWITKLQPRFASIWAFHSWNMAYNVSVMFSEAADRWRWVRHGISLLRDEGLYHNPDSPQLYGELGWLFQHKVATNVDSAHTHYKQQWAREMELVIPGGRATYEQWRSVASTPAQLQRRAPVAELTARLKERGWDPYSRDLLQPDKLPDDIADLLSRHPGAPELLAFIRLNTLKDDYKLDPAMMQSLEQAVGPLDWRLPQTHAAYWAFAGRPHSEGFDRISLNRMIYQSLADLYLNGRTVTAPDGRTVSDTMPDALPAAIRGFDLALGDFPGERSFRGAHENFLRQAILESYLLGQEDTSRELYDRLRKTYAPEEPERGYEYVLYGSFLSREDTLGPDQAAEAIDGLSRTADGLRAIGDFDRAEACLRLQEICRRQLRLHPPPELPPPSEEPPPAVPAGILEHTHHHHHHH